MATEVSICSNALRRLGDDPITSLTDDTQRARLCNSFYPDARDAVLRLHTWNFAATRASLAKLATAPAYGYANQFSLPSDCLRVLKVHNGSTDSIKSDIDYKLEGRNIVTNEGTVYIIYIAIDTDPNNYDTYLQESISHQLAADLAYAVTNNATLAKNYQVTADERLREARFVDATENSLGTVESNEFTDARL